MDLDFEDAFTDGDTSWNQSKDADDSNEYATGYGSSLPSTHHLNISGDDKSNKLASYASGGLRDDGIVGSANNDRVDEEEEDFADATLLPADKGVDSESNRGRKKFVNTDSSSPKSTTSKSRSRSGSPSKKIPKVGKEQFEILKCIGSGAYGKVYQVQHRVSKTIYAMKVVPKELLIKKNHVRYMNAERNILTKVNHPFIVQLSFAFQSSKRVFLVMDFCHGGELFLLLRKEGLLLEDNARFYAVEMILALEHLHSLDIIHRDLKPENVLLGSDGHIKITDFGLAKEQLSDNDRTKTICGTNEYMAPEMIAGGGGYGKAVDWWSLGTLLYEMLTGNPPFKAREKQKLYKKILTEKISLPRWLSADCMSLLKGLLERNVENRLGARKSTMFQVGGVQQLKAHPFFKGVDWNRYLAMQVEAPIKLKIDNDMDTQHFDEHFTKMGTSFDVKSYVENGEDRDGSATGDDLFKGFSYVADDVMHHAENFNRERVLSALPEGNGESPRSPWGPSPPPLEGDGDAEKAVAPTLTSPPSRAPRRIVAGNATTEDSLSSADNADAAGVDNSLTSKLLPPSSTTTKTSSAPATIPINSDTVRSMSSTSNISTGSTKKRSALAESLAATHIVDLQDTGSSHSHSGEGAASVPVVTSALSADSGAISQPKGPKLAPWASLTASSTAIKPPTVAATPETMPANPPSKSTEPKPQQWASRPITATGAVPIKATPQSVAPSPVAVNWPQASAAAPVAAAPSKPSSWASLLKKETAVPESSVSVSTVVSEPVEVIRSTPRTNPISISGRGPTVNAYNVGGDAGSNSRSRMGEHRGHDGVSKTSANPVPAPSPAPWAPSWVKPASRPVTATTSVSIPPSTPSAPLSWAAKLASPSLEPAAPLPIKEFVPQSEKGPDSTSHAAWFNPKAPAFNPKAQAWTPRR